MGVTPTLASKDEVPTPRSSTREEDFLRNVVQVFRETPSIFRKARAPTSKFFFLFHAKTGAADGACSRKKINDYLLPPDEYLAHPSETDHFASFLEDRSLGDEDSSK